MKHVIFACSALFACAPQTALAQRTKPSLARKLVENVISVGRYKWRTHQKTDFSGTTFRNLDIATDRYAFQIGGKVRDVTIENARISLRAPTTGGDLPAAVAVSSSALVQNIVIRDSEFFDFRQVPSDAYPQGDGIDCDSRATTLLIERVYSHDNGDGGFDTKCITTFRNTRAERNNWNYRLWGSVTATKIASADPRRAHIQTTGGTKATINGLFASGSTGKPVVLVNKPTEPGHYLRMTNCRYNFSVPTKVVHGPAKYIKTIELTFDASCAPDAKGFAANTPVTITTGV